jgi:choline dehydrogenase-like flavoprotein
MSRMRESYDLIVVGSSFSASFFLHRYLERMPRARVLVLERGIMNTHAWQLDGGRQKLNAAAERAFVNRTPGKDWTFLHTFGGNSNCWYGCTPRMLPDDFRLYSKFGVGVDWPIQYDELEPYYCDAEDIMEVAGPVMDDTPFPRSRPYPQGPHRFTAVDALFKRTFPRELFVQPCARPSHATEKRPACCANVSCHLCPIDSKFTVLNELAHLYEDPRVKLVLDACVQAVEVEGGRVAKGVRYVHKGREETAVAEVVVLGANALFNPHILIRSGLDHPELGRGLGEQVGTHVIAHLDGVENFGGGTWVIGHWYGLHGLYDRSRADRAAALVELVNLPQLRQERGKERQVALMRVIYENLRRGDNRVTVSTDDPTKPEVSYAGHSDYTQRGLDSLRAELPRRLAALPVDEIFFSPRPFTTEAHIMGTTVMGSDPGTSVVDPNQVHQSIRNLLVLGSGTFPTMAPANPTLTISALALRAADFVVGMPKRIA